MKNALVVEDSKSEQKLVQALLEKMEIKVDIADNGEEALDWLKSNDQPDLILLDIVMPDMNGLELCREIRETLGYADIPIIFCSNKSEEFDRFWALRQGGNAYITKPYSPMDLIKTVKAHL
ncbi:response regulator receiver protein [[Leptolyngbya] sp. PCC 7376]|uniref:response regulator n=1 Tax=[Leptolyngbya] sp. PCC 7376 TaxID=111781 RepID=UPI00029F4B5D|nr:response regulator [[Leptolyngbya] sp. PCC 7376]AFY37105.1 response regulator receiver protein [[Leptolyngbya] sp. PCC 7376]